jgi:hypothetical protein
LLFAISPIGPKLTSSARTAAAEAYGYENGTRRGSRPDHAALSRSEAIRRLIEIALTTKSKRHSKRGEK